MHTKLLFFILTATLATSGTLLANDLRGEVEGPAGPLAGKNVALFAAGPNNSLTLLHSATTVAGGLYYFNAIAQGDYVLQVDGKNYPFHVDNRTQQDIPSIRLGGAPTPTPVPTATASPVGTSTPR